MRQLLARYLLAALVLTLPMAAAAAGAAENGRGRSGGQSTRIAGTPRPAVRDVRQSQPTGCGGMRTRRSVPPCPRHGPAGDAAAGYQLQASVNDMAEKRAVR
jgi:hypothetical protein